MAGFRAKKAAPQQAALKVGLYGPTGSGKTFTTLLAAEGLAAVTGKRVLFIDTERGTDFYAQAVPDRSVHPEAFDFDAVYTRSITEILDIVQRADTSYYGVIVIDSISHVWDAAIGAYKGKTTSIGTIPMNAWGNIKKPYKDLMAALLSSPLHVFFCGRQANVFGEDDEGELKKTGVKMRAEGETQYEPHICIRMEQDPKKAKGKVVADILAFAEKDRTGVLSGRCFVNPNFNSLIKPLLKLLGDHQAVMDTDDVVATKDAEAMTQAEANRAKESEATMRRFAAEFDLAATKGIEEVERVGKTLTADVKKGMLPAHVNQLREKYIALTSNRNTNERRLEPVGAE